MRRLAALLAAALVLTAPTSALAATEPTTTTAGLSETTLDLGGVRLGDLVAESLGSARVLATTADEAPASVARAVLPGGRSFEVTSADDADVQAQQVNLAGLGSVRLAGLTADADDRAATAAVEALRAQLAPLGLQLGSQAGEFVAQSGTRSTAADNTVALTGLSVSLGDLLGEDLLAQLPLGVLLDLGDLLGLNLGGLGAGQLEQLLGELAAGQTLATQVKTAQATLTSARAAVTAAEQQLASAQAAATAAANAVTAKQQEITNLQNQIGNLACTVVPALCSQLQAAQAELTTLQAQLTAAQQAVTAATNAVNTARAAVTTAENALNALLDQVDALLDRLTQLLAQLDNLDLTALLQRLRDALEGVELLGVDTLTLSVATTATQDTSEATARCRVEGVRVAGQAVDVDACRQLSAALGDVTAQIVGLLEVLPIAPGQLGGDLVTVTPPAISVTDRNATRDGAQFARASVTGLGLAIAPLDLAALTSEDLLGPVTAFVNGVLPDFAALPGIDVTAVTAALQALITQVSALPVGDLEGLSTPALELLPAGLTASSEFGVAVTGPGGRPTGGTGTPGGGDDDDTPTLPATGGGVGAGLVLLLAGVGAAAWLRRRPT